MLNFPVKLEIEVLTLIWVGSLRVSVVVVCGEGKIYPLSKTCQHVRIMLETLLPRPP